jgi:hypothetical protein
MATAATAILPDRSFAVELKSEKKRGSHADGIIFEQSSIK